VLLFILDLNIHVWVSGHWYWYDVLHLNVSCICIIITMFVVGVTYISAKQYCLQQMFDVLYSSKLLITKLCCIVRYGFEYS